MRRIIRIMADRETGNVTVKADAALGVSVSIEIGGATLSMVLDAENARKLGGSLVDAADELEGRDETR